MMNDYKKKGIKTEIFSTTRNFILLPSPQNDSRFNKQIIFTSWLPVNRKDSFIYFGGDLDHLINIQDWNLVSIDVIQYRLNI